jgi:hypothetical protein
VERGNKKRVERLPGTVETFYSSGDGVTLVVFKKYV